MRNKPASPAQAFPNPSTAASVARALGQSEPAAAMHRLSQAGPMGATGGHQVELPLMCTHSLLGEDVRSAAQLLAVGHLHKENDDRFYAITCALERDVDYKLGTIRVKEGVRHKFMSHTCCKGSCVQTSCWVV